MLLLCRNFLFSFIVMISCSSFLLSFVILTLYYVYCSFICLGFSNTAWRLLAWSGHQLRGGRIRGCWREDHRSEVADVSSEAGTCPVSAWRPPAQRWLLSALQLSAQRWSLLARRWSLSAWRLSVWRCRLGGCWLGGGWI